MLPLILALERDPRRLCAFTCRLRVHNADEFLIYLGMLLVLCNSFLATEVAA